MFIDPATGDIYLLTKRDNPSEIYRLRWPLSTSTINIPEFLGTMRVTRLTAADISPDGNKILARTTGSIFGWSRRPGESIEDALKRNPTTLPYLGNDSKGEAIAWAFDNTGYYTATERDTSSDPAPITFYEIQRDIPIIVSPLTANGTVGTPFSYQIEAENDPESFALFRHRNGSHQRRNRSHAWRRRWPDRLRHASRLRRRSRHRIRR